MKQQDYIYFYNDAQNINYNSLAFVKKSDVPGFAVFEIENANQHVTLSLDRIKVKPEVQRMLSQMKVAEPWQDVVDFHKKFGIDYDGPPRTLPPDLKEFRTVCLKEEMAEIQSAANPAEELDGYIDLIYFALGTIRLNGWDFNKAWSRVHAANMAKVKAQSASDSKRGFSGDIVKPKGWVAPDLSDLV